MESIKLLVQTDHKFLMQASIFCRCVTNVTKSDAAPAYVKILIVNSCVVAPRNQGLRLRSGSADSRNFDHLGESQSQTKVGSQTYDQENLLKFVSVIVSHSEPREGSWSVENLSIPRLAGVQFLL